VEGEIFKLIYEKYEWRDLETKLASLSNSGFHSLSLNKFIIYSESEELITYIDQNLKLNDVMKTIVKDFSDDRGSENLSNTVFRQKLISKLGSIEFSELLNVINNFRKQSNSKVEFVKKRLSIFATVFNLIKKLKISLIIYVFIRFISGIRGLVKRPLISNTLVVTPDWLIESEGIFIDPSVRRVLNDLKNRSQPYTYLTIPHRGSNRFLRICNLFKAKHITLETVLFFFFFKDFGKSWSIEKIIKSYLKASDINIMFVSSEYSRLSETFVSAANDLNILTIGVQHGAITKFHPGYAQGNWSSSLRPRKMMVMDYDARQQLMELGLQESRIIMIGRDSKQSVKSRNKRPEPIDKKKLLIVSNPFIQSRLQTGLLSKPNYVLDRRYIVDVKLHPNEESIGYFYKSDFIKSTIKALNILPKDLDIENIIEDYDVVVSFASTVLSTSFDLGIPTIELKDDILFFERFYDLKGHEELSRLSQTSFQDLIGFLNNFDTKAWALNYNMVKKG